MTALPEFPRLDTPAKCAALWPKYPKKVVGMWATGMPRQNVDVLWRLREELIKLGVPVVFFFAGSALPMIQRVYRQNLSPEIKDVYQLDDVKFFRLLNFVEVLVTNDYLVDAPNARHIGAKLVGMPHHAGVVNPTYWNFFYDYFVGEKTYLTSFDYRFFPNVSKLHRQPSFTQLVAGHPKIDLILEERQKSSVRTAAPVLLIYLTYVDFSISMQKIDPNTYMEMWERLISSYFAWTTNGIAVFRPMGNERHLPVVERLKAKLAPSGRFFLDEDDDNKFWLARANYFVTDYSRGFINFCMTAKKPVVRLIHTPEETKPVRDEWGWVISRPSQFIPLLEEMDRDAKDWGQSLAEKQASEMPSLGRNFVLLAGMIKRILEGDEDPAWLRMEKGDTPSSTLADKLRLMAKLTKKSPYELTYINYWLNGVMLIQPAEESPKIWLLFLRRALLPSHIADTPDHIARFADMWLDYTLQGLPFTQGVGLIRHLLRKYPQKSAASLLLMAASCHLSGPRKKRALFFLLMEWAQYDPSVLQEVNNLAEKMPQHFSRPVLDKLNRVLPRIMKIPLPLRRLAARALGLKKPLAKRYWQAHLALR